MLEESRMDKKSLNRSSQPQPRASVVDCKKNTDLTHKPWPRNNKKREVSGSVPKNDPYRKNAQFQRGRGQVDRRPRPRGSAVSLGGAASTGIGDDQDEPEIGSVYSPGSKKQNLNHLLNFMYPTRGGTDRRGPLPRRQGQQRTSFRADKDLYLRAYCQFVVKEDGDYKVNLLDPDVPIIWEQIKEIVVRSTGKSECPICLGPPVAGRVGHCGHVYCWACVLHYAAAHEKQPPPCPVCSTSLQVKDMKPTIMVQWPSPTEEVTMRLVRRLRGSTVVEVAPHRGQIVDTATDELLPLDRINNAPYCKLFRASRQQVQDILDRERKEIQNQIMAEIDTTEIVFLEQALELLKAEEENNKLTYDAPKSVEETLQEEAVPTVYEKIENREGKLDWFDVTDEGAACVDTIQDQIQQLGISSTQSDLNPEAPEFNQPMNDESVEDFHFCGTELSLSENEPDSPNLTENDKQNQSKYFYFYQAEDGQQVFLNSLNVRILNASWGALAAAPPIIRGRVLHRETFSLCEQTRKHMPYTAHLPLHCAFDIVEMDLHPPYVTTAALKSFADELDRRARARARHEREERRRERAYRRAIDGPPKPDVFSEVLFPPAAPVHCSPPLFDPVLPPLLEQSSSSMLEQPSSSSGSIVPLPSGVSFAKMAGTSGTWRVRQTPAPLPPPPPLSADDEHAAPRALVLSDAIEAALHAASTPAPKKNKKSKHKVLFATGMHRAA